MRTRTTTTTTRSAAALGILLGSFRLLLRALLGLLGLLLRALLLLPQLLIRHPQRRPRRRRHLHHLPRSFLTDRRAASFVLVVVAEPDALHDLPPRAAVLPGDPLHAQPFHARGVHVVRSLILRGTPAQQFVHLVFLERRVRDVMLGPRLQPQRLGHGLLLGRLDRGDLSLGAVGVGHLRPRPAVLLLLARVPQDVLAPLPSPHGRLERVAEVVLAVLVALDVVPVELVLTSARAAARRVSSSHRARVSRAVRARPPCEMKMPPTFPDLSLD